MTKEAVEKFFAMDRTKVVVRDLHERGNDLCFWQKQPYEFRLATLERIRQEYHDGVQQGLQRVLRMIEFGS